MARNGRVMGCTGYGGVQLSCDGPCRAADAALHPACFERLRRQRHLHGSAKRAVLVLIAYSNHSDLRVYHLDEGGSTVPGCVISGCKLGRNSRLLAKAANGPCCLRCCRILKLVQVGHCSLISRDRGRCQLTTAFTDRFENFKLKIQGRVTPGKRSWSGLGGPIVPGVTNEHCKLHGAHGCRALPASRLAGTGTVALNRAVHGTALLRHPVHSLPRASQIVVSLRTDARNCPLARSSSRCVGAKTFTRLLPQRTGAAM